MQITVRQRTCAKWFHARAVRLNSVSKRDEKARRAIRQNKQSNKQRYKLVAIAPLVFPRSICVVHFALFLLYKHWLGHYFHIPIIKRKKGIASTAYNLLVYSLICCCGNDYMNDKNNTTIRSYDWLMRKNNREARAVRIPEHSFTTHCKTGH